MQGYLSYLQKFHLSSRKYVWKRIMYNRDGNQKRLSSVDRNLKEFLENSKQVQLDWANKNHHVKQISERVDKEVRAILPNRILKNLGLESQEEGAVKVINKRALQNAFFPISFHPLQALHRRAVHQCSSAPKYFCGSLGNHQLACLLLTLKHATHDRQSLPALTFMRSMVEKHSHIYSQGNLTNYLYSPSFINVIGIVKVTI